MGFWVTFFATAAITDAFKLAVVAGFTTTAASVSKMVCRPCSLFLFFWNFSTSSGWDWTNSLLWRSVSTITFELSAAKTSSRTVWRASGSSLTSSNCSTSSGWASIKASSSRSVSAITFGLSTTLKFLVKMIPTSQILPLCYLPQPNFRLRYLQLLLLLLQGHFWWLQVSKNNLKFTPALIGSFKSQSDEYMDASILIKPEQVLVVLQ